MRRYRGLLLLGVAVLMAAFTSMLIYGWLQQQRSASVESPTPEVVALPTQMVAVAAIDLLWGTPLTQEIVKLVPFPVQSVPGGSFSTFESLQGRVLIAHVVANEPILEAKLAPRDVTKGGVAAVTNPKKRAMAVRVDDVVGVAGFINPGNKVDVMVTLKSEPPVTKTVLQNVLVLATGTEIERRGKEDKPQQVRVVTVEVSPEEGEKLALASNEGKVQLALRNYLASEPVLTRGATVPNLLESYRLPEEHPKKVPPPLPPPPAPPVVKKEEPAKKSVEVILGGKVSTFTFKEE